MAYSLLRIGYMRTQERIENMIQNTAFIGIALAVVIAALDFSPLTQEVAAKAVNGMPSVGIAEDVDTCMRANNYDQSLCADLSYQESLNK